MLQPNVKIYNEPLTKMLYSLEIDYYNPKGTFENTSIASFDIPNFPYQPDINLSVIRSTTLQQSLNSLGTDFSIGAYGEELTYDWRRNSYSRNISNTYSIETPWALFQSLK